MFDELDDYRTHIVLAVGDTYPLRKVLVEEVFQDFGRGNLLI